MTLLLLRFAIAASIVLRVCAAVSAEPVTGSDRRQASASIAAPDGQHVAPAGAALTPLHIENVRLEAARGDAAEPSTVLKFDVVNGGLNRLADFVLQISMVEKRAGADPTAASGPPRVLVGPVDVTGKVVIGPGYTISYEMLFRNFSADCSCLPKVDVISARRVRE